MRSACSASTSRLSTRTRSSRASAVLSIVSYSLGRIVNDQYAAITVRVRQQRFWHDRRYSGRPDCGSQQDPMPTGPTSLTPSSRRRPGTAMLASGRPPQRVRGFSGTQLDRTYDLVRCSGYLYRGRSRCSLGL